MLRQLALISLFLTTFFSSLSALTIDLNIGREAGESFSVIHIKEELAFKCLSKQNEFDVTTQIQCTFPREPKEKFEAFSTNFFKIDSFTHEKKYIVRIYPVQKMQLFPAEYTLYEKSKIYQPKETKLSKHWMIIGYQNRLPLIKPESTPPLGINFPLEMPEVKLPSIGALDVAGNPIGLDQVEDVKAYMRIKHAYDAGNYEDLAKDVDAVFKRFPHTIFKAELLLYKMRGHHHSNESESLLLVSKEFIRDYSDDINMPEVLAYTANAYSNVGLQVDGSYFFERLFKEYPESKFAPLGMVYLGDQYFTGGKPKPAEEYFEKALYKTKDVDIASMAAIRLVRINLDNEKFERASELIDKIIEGNAKYLLHDVAENYDTARRFQNRGYQKTGANILKVITAFLPQGDDRYETMIKDIGIWLSETDDKAAAYEALKKYQTMYGDDSDYTQIVQGALDGLFYTPEDANKTALLAEYEALEAKYENAEIGQKALIQKAKLLFALKRYQEVLDLDASAVEEEDEYINIVHDTAKAYAIASLKEGQCDKAIALNRDHNLSLEREHDESLYGCAYQTGSYILANKLASEHIKDKENKLKWLYSYAKTLGKLGQYKKLTEVAPDVMTLSQMEKSSQYDDILSDTFSAYERLDDAAGMVKTIKEIEKRRALSNEDIELYVAMVKLGLKQRDDILIETYADKVMRLQEETKSYSQSPFVEFAALQVLKSQKKEKEQLALLKKLITLELSANDSSRAQYMYGSLLIKTGKNAEAKAAFEASIAADSKSAWASLSKDALALVE